MKRLTILAIIAGLALLIGSAAVIGGPAGPPDGLDVKVVDPLPLPVTGTVDVSTEYRFVGLSTEETDGDGGGYIGMNAKCQSAFGPSARMCTSKEFFLTGVGTPLDGPAWINPSIIALTTEVNDDDPPNIVSWTVVLFRGQMIRRRIAEGVGSLDSCGTWRCDSHVCFGWTVTPTGGVDTQYTCDQEKPIACCAPVNQTP